VLGGQWSIADAALAAAPFLGRIELMLRGPLQRGPGDGRSASSLKKRRSRGCGDTVSEGYEGPPKLAGNIR